MADPITTILSIIMDFFDPEIVRAIAVIAILICIWLLNVIRDLKKKNEEKENPDDKLVDELTNIKYKITEYEQFGLSTCCLSNIKDTTDVAIYEANHSFLAMVTAGTKIIESEHFDELVKLGITNGKDKIKILILNPNHNWTNVIDKLTNTKHKDYMKTNIITNIHEFNKHKENISVKFYPNDFIPQIRAIYINNYSGKTSYYVNEENYKEIRELTILNKKGGLYNTYKIMFDFLWNSGEDINWEEYQTPLV